MRRPVDPVTCACPEPQPYTRPSGTVICLNPWCGGQIVAAPSREERP